MESRIHREVYVRFGGEEFGNLFSREEKALNSLAYYVSELLGKETIDTNTYGKSSGRSGNYSTNYQISGRELLTPDEVRMLDNRYALLFVRGERPVMDFKYDILKHPNVKLTADGGQPPYIHGEPTQAVATLVFDSDIPKNAVSVMPVSTSYELLSDEDLEEIFNI